MTGFHPLQTHIALVYDSCTFIAPGDIIWTVFFHSNKAFIRYTFCALGKYNRPGVRIDYYGSLQLTVSSSLTGRLDTVTALIREKIPYHTVLYFMFTESNDFIIKAVEVRGVLVASPAKLFRMVSGKILPFLTGNLTSPARSAF
jgi:hypothetical protein